MYPKNRRLKYRNIKTVIDGMRFDSKKEGNYYLRLKNDLLKGLIKAFECQPVVNLFVDPERNGAHVKFTPDFKVTRPDGSFYFVDVKSEITRKESSYVLRRKLLKLFYKDVEFVEV